MAVRFLLLRQQAFVLANDYEEARRTEIDIHRRLAVRAQHDHGAATLLQVQNRRAGAVMSPEIAVRRIEEAVDYFRGEGAGERAISRSSYVH